MTADLQLFPSQDPPGVERTAVLSLDGCYRYVLRRAWATGPMVTWVMLNPSTADATADDATIRTIIGFSRRWGMGGLAVVNLYAYRSRHPRALSGAEDPVGPDNDAAIAEWVRAAQQVVVGWGAHRMPGLPDRAAFVRSAAAQAGATLMCIGKTADGSPFHPLMKSHSLPLTRWP